MLTCFEVLSELLSGSARFVRCVGMVWAIHVDWAKERAVSGAFDGCLKLWAPWQRQKEQQRKKDVLIWKQ